MTNPVMQALVNARLQEQDQRDLALNAVVSSRLNLPAREGDRTAWPMFKAWCEQNGITPFPARPASVGYFILDNLLLGIDALLKIVESISAVHEGVADPTSSPLVSAALNQVAPIEPPRSWPKEHKQRFVSLPYGLQIYVAAHEAQRDKAVRRAQSETAIAKQKLAAFQQPPKQGSDGIQSHPAA